jgi:23S rRNA-/tRNA-specific pseudouridylate synthase
VVPLRYGKTGASTLTLVQFDLETGRSHQIRVQSAHEGLPLLGDAKYGNGSKASRDFGRPALHSARISFPHPMSGEIHEYECALPADMTAIEQWDRPVGKT